MTATLAELNFSDLLIGDSGIFLKNLTGAPHNLTLVEGDLISDVEKVRTALDTEAKGRDEFPLDYDGIRYRVSKTQTVGGLLYVMRKGAPDVPDIWKLGLVSALVEKLLDKNRKEGLILFSGQMGSGKTTTASALIKAWLEKFGGHAVALEDPPELPLQEQCTKNGRCYQIDISGKSMADEIIRTLRRAANLIFLGELRDAGAISEALRASINGHLIVATIHASSPMAALQKILTMGSKIDGVSTWPTLAQGFEAVVHQKMDPVSRRVSTHFLFAEQVSEASSCSVRAKIRSDDIHKLTDNMTQQMTRMRNELRLQGRNKAV